MEGFEIMKIVKLLLSFFILLSGVNSSPYKELVPEYNRKKSPAMIRKIEKPTLANLDYSAYDNNPIRYDSEKYKPIPPEKNINVKDIMFGDKLDNVVNLINETPLTEDEKNNPMAWEPMQNHLWSELKIDEFKRLSGVINGYKWNDPDIFKPYQLVTTCYLHTVKSETEVWVKVEFSDWVGFLNGVTDDDKDGFLEIYAKLNCSEIEADKKEKTFNWIKNSYQKKILTEEDVLDWITVLSSYWYPTLNTDMVDMTDEKQWPNENTEKKIRRKLKKNIVDNPIAVVRGNPLGKPIYNVYLVSGMGNKVEEKTVEAQTTVNKKMDIKVSENFNINQKLFKDELDSYGGSYESWYQKNSVFIEKQKKNISLLPKEQMGIEGADGWVFFRKTFDYIAAKNLDKQATDKNPIKHIVAFKDYCDNNNTNLIFVPVPTKAEVYFEKTGVTGNDNRKTIINSYGRKILADLQNAGVEVIDLLPHFLSAKVEDEKFKEHVFQKQDTHWTNRGLQITAELIAKRIKEYSWYDECDSLKEVFNSKDTSFVRRGDIVERLPETKQINYKPATLSAQRITTKDGKRYKGNRKMPILLIGDSFTGVFESVDCKSAGVGSHIAEKTGLGVDIITSWGGGPLVRNKMIRARKNDMGVKRLVIYMMVARDLFDYGQGWEELKIK